MSVALIDLAAGSPAAAARALGAAFAGNGFCAVTGHGVPAPVQEAAFAANRRFFALPESVKTRWHIDRSPQRRGFDPVGWQALDPERPPDLKESFYLGVEAIGPNQWPDEGLVPGFRAACADYARHMEALARRLMTLIEMALHLPRGHFDAFMRAPICTTRLLHYPPRPAAIAPGQLGCGAHTDWGAISLLAQDDAGGLQVRSAGGDWEDVAPIPGALVVNTGDMMQRWTNDRWPSTLHRVINRASGRERYSIAYFFDLDADAAIEPLASCVDADHPPRYAPITAGEHLAEMYRRTTVNA
ncbi:MAG: isopenicillin N synthase family oxygenase [Burkholderiales bacterium]|nr:isopenicillin N synthase family oxygenase [Burkholderiales bacterium]